MVRHPAVAGQFYPGSYGELKLYLDSFCRLSKGRIKAKAVVVPHAGYIYSGKVAGETYSKVEIPSLNVILGPNHTGIGEVVSVYPEGVWVTPFGEVPVDEEVVNTLTSRGIFSKDTLAHIYEHSLEVQLPFLQFCSNFRKDLSIVPVVFKHLDYSDCLVAGETLAQSIKERSAMIVISTDFSHYVPQKEAERLDSYAIDAILNLDPEELYRRVLEYRISMCGVIPTVVGLVAARLLGAEKAELVLYRTSGDVSGDYEQVVGYAGIIVY